MASRIAVIALVGVGAAAFSGVPSSFGPLLRRALAENPEEITKVGSFLGNKLANYGLKRAETHFDRRINLVLLDMPPSSKRDLYELLLDPDVKNALTMGASLSGMPKPTIQITHLALKACAAYPAECERQAKLAAMKVAQKKYEEYRRSKEYLRDCSMYLPIQSRDLVTSLGNNQMSKQDCDTIDRISRINWQTDVRYRHFVGH